MLRRLVFVIVYIICLPLCFLALLIAFFGMIISPIVWVITGDEEKVWMFIFTGKVQGWLIDLPYKITGYEIK